MTGCARCTGCACSDLGITFPASQVEPCATCSHGLWWHGDNSAYPGRWADVKAALIENGVWAQLDAVEDSMVPDVQP